MDRVKEPFTFKDLVEADLRRAVRLITKLQDEIDPQFRIATPEGDYWIALQLPPDKNHSRKSCDLHGVEAGAGVHDCM